MKCIAILVICTFWATFVVSAAEEKYTDEFDGINVDEVLHSDRLFNNYYNCLKTGQKCTPDGQKLRELLPDALKTKCAKCTETQNRQSKIVIRFLIKEKPDKFKELEAMFDPNHEYVKAYENELKEEGITIPT